MKIRVRISRLQSFLALFSFWIFVGLFANANPSAKSPEKSLAVHGLLGDSAPLATSIQEVVMNADEIFTDLTETQGKSLNTKELAALNASLYLAVFDAERLIAMGEPLGSAMKATLRRLTDERDFWLMRAERINPQQVAKEAQASLKQLQKGSKSILKFNEQLNEAMKLGEGETMLARGRMFATNVSTRSAFLKSNQYREYIGNLFPKMSENEIAYAKSLQAQALKKADALANEAIEAIDKFDAETRSLADQLRGKSVIKLADGSEVGLVGAVDEFVRLWGNASANLTRAAALKAAFASDFRSVDLKNREMLHAVIETAIENLGELIVSGSSGVESSERGQVLSKLASKIATLDRQMESLHYSLIESMQPILDEFAAVDVSFKQQVNAYDQATSQPLYWRMFFIEQRLKNQGMKNLTVDELMRTKSSSKETPPATEYTKVKFNPKVVARLEMVDPPFVVARHLANTAVGKTVVTPPTVRLGDSIKLTLSPLRVNFYCNAVLKPDLSLATETLRKAILVDPEHPPLTLESADAISGLEKQEFESITGTISNAHVEGRLTRLLSVKDTTHLLCPLGVRAPISRAGTASYQYAYRFDIETSGAMTRYVEIPPTSSR
ncbi:MAG: hypothetical protein AAF664_21345 [Planctomycetota bacterium]